MIVTASLVRQYARSPHTTISAISLVDSITFSDSTLVSPRANASRPIIGCWPGDMNMASSDISDSTASISPACVALSHN